MSRLNMFKFLLVMCTALLMPCIAQAEEIMNCQPDGTHMPRELTLPAEPGAQIEATFNGIEVDGFSHGKYGLIKTTWTLIPRETRKTMSPEDLSKLKSIDGIFIRFYCAGNDGSPTEMNPDQPCSCAVGESMTLEYISPNCAADNPDPEHHPDKKAHFTVIRKRENSQPSAVVAQPAQVNVTSGAATKNFYQVPEASSANVRVESGRSHHCVIS